MFNSKINSSLCQLCGESITDQKHFYRKHNLTMGQYYQTHFPRKDLLTGEQIPFKDLEHYEHADFLNKNNLKKWVQTSPVDQVAAYLKEITVARKESKQLKYTPTQAELRSLQNFPSIITFNKVFGNYYKFCEEIGFCSRGFLPPPKKLPYLEGDLFEDSPVILIDTREQNWLKLGTQFEIATLNYGDYCLQNSKHKIFIERKSLTDAIGSFTTNRDRFENELERAKNDGAYIVVLIEDSFSNCMGFNHLPWVTKKIKVSPEFLFHNIREIIQKFDNCQFVFAPGRKAAADLLKKILLSRDMARKYDLQLLLDTKILH